MFVTSLSMNSLEEMGILFHTLKSKTSQASCLVPRPDVWSESVSTLSGLLETVNRPKYSCYWRTTKGFLVQYIQYIMQDCITGIRDEK